MEGRDEELEVEPDRSGEAGQVEEKKGTGARGRWPYRGEEQREQERGRKRDQEEPGSG